MNIQHQYVRQVDEITSEELRPDLYYQNERSPLGPERRWPKVIGIMELISGFITAILGTMEVFILPMTDNIHDNGLIKFDKSNCYGAGVLAGVMMIITGATAIRASISKRASTVYRFYNLTMFTLLLYAGLTVFLIVAFGLGWTTRDKYPPHSHVHEIHIFVTVSTLLGLMFVTSAFVRYYDLIFCGEMQLGRKWLDSCCWCFQSNLQNRETRPSLLDRNNGPGGHLI